MSFFRPKVGTRLCFKTIWGHYKPFPEVLKDHFFTLTLTFENNVRVIPTLRNKNYIDLSQGKNIFENIFRFFFEIFELSSDKSKNLIF